MAKWFGQNLVNTITVFADAKSKFDIRLIKLNNTADFIWYLGSMKITIFY